MATLLAVNSGRYGWARRQAVGQGAGPFFRQRRGQWGSSESRSALVHSSRFSLALGLESRPSPVWMARVGAAALALALGLKDRGTEAWSPGTGRAVLAAQGRVWSLPFPTPLCVCGPNSCRICSSPAMRPGDLRYFSATSAGWKLAPQNGHWGPSWRLGGWVGSYRKRGPLIMKPAIRKVAQECRDSQLCVCGPPLDAPVPSEL